MLFVDAIGFGGREMDKIEFSLYTLRMRSIHSGERHSSPDRIDQTRSQQPPARPLHGEKSLVDQRASIF